ncbi:sodium channel subunit beta-2-like [Sphaeramia orbicularis]|uniref:sodium channel subunit beta-2-like n=1 Tax=Sphaeramia orbicularis TaxID=375764 RepID=UPI001180A152|nr:sodium channel subunit beta-2-like [Sphaeramia orbicularis]
MAFSSSSSSLWTVYVVVVSRCCCADLQVMINPGQDVALPCFSPPGNVNVLEWVKQDLESPLYVFFLRRNLVVESFLHPSFRTRTALSDDGIHGNMTVILRNVTIKDTGTYECRVSVDTAKSRKPALQNIVHLKVEEVSEDPDSFKPPLVNTQTRQDLFDVLSVAVGVGVFLLFIIIILSSLCWYRRRTISQRLHTENTKRHDTGTIRNVSFTPERVSSESVPIIGSQ